MQPPVQDYVPQYQEVPMQQVPVQIFQTPVPETVYAPVQYYQEQEQDNTQYYYVPEQQQGYAGDYGSYYGNGYQGQGQGQGQDQYYDQGEYYPIQTPMPRPGRMSQQNAPVGNGQPQMPYAPPMPQMPPSGSYGGQGDFGGYYGGGMQGGRGPIPTPGPEGYDDAVRRVSNTYFG
jgi:hypothetical protein